MKVVLFGKNGLLGSQFGSQLKGVELFSFGHDNVDVTDFKQLEGIFGQTSPDVVINCTGYTRVDDAEDDKKEAFKLNAEAPKNMAKLCDKFGAILIHFSTDYVFDGRKIPPDGYNEAYVPNPLNVYGESKFLGEEGVINGMKRFYIIRTSWLYGPNGKNFVDTMLRLGKEVVAGGRNGLKIVNDQFGSPTYSADLACAVIEHFIGKDPDKALHFGIYHLTNDGFTNWHEFAVEIFELAGMKVEVKPISSKEYPQAANRPKNSILLNTKLPKLRGWREAVRDYLASCVRG